MKSKYLLLATLVFASCVSKQRMASENGTINIGYTEIRKDRLTTSVSDVKVDEKVISSYSNIYDYIRGKVPGVNVMGSGPNAKIVIRGINSINCPTDPLFIVDGREVSDISTINPMDVKSISVLKDASSSIYGVRGANGVIIITLK